MRERELQEQNEQMGNSKRDNEDNLLGKRQSAQRHDTASKKKKRAAANQDSESEDENSPESSYTQIDEDSYHDYKPSAEQAKQRSNQS